MTECKDNVNSNRGPRINNSAAVLQAAIDGHGVAPGQGVMVRDDPAAGRLVRRQGRTTCQSQLAYYMVFRAESTALPRLYVFRERLRSESLTMQRSMDK
jgi:LysR family transcriptional regulator, glycine cleavage system transcriptional activator